MRLNISNYQFHFYTPDIIDSLHRTEDLESTICFHTMLADVQTSHLFVAVYTKAYCYINNFENQSHTQNYKSNSRYRTNHLNTELHRIAAIDETIVAKTKRRFAEDTNRYGSPYTT